MEKLVSRPSGGGAKLGTLDMASYLEVMTRQLAEIQAQHNQFYASRQERLGRARNQEPGLLKFCSSESNSALKQQACSGDHEPSSDERSRGTQDPQQNSSPSISSSSAASGGAAGKSASTAQGGARRSLNFADEPSINQTPNAADRGGRPPTVRGAGAALQARSNGGIRAHNSSPPSVELSESVAVGQGSRAARGRQQPRRPSGRPSSSAHIPAGPPRRPEAGTPDSVSSSAPHSISPSSGSGRPSTSNAGTPSVSSAYTQATGASPAPARLTPESTESSPAGPYAVYQVSGVASISYSTSPTKDEGEPGVVSKGFSTPATSGGSPSADSYLGRQGPYTGSPSAPSADSSALAVHEQRHADTEEDSAAEEDAPSFALALAGQAFDGIDSEEDDEEAQAQHPSGSYMVVSNASRLADGSTAAGPSHGKGIDAGQAPQRAQIPSLNLAQGAPPPAPESRPQSRATARAPLVVASLETEEALRTLLATPRLANAGGAALAASIDVEGLEVPDDVLAALAKTDGLDLDAALGAAMTASLRAQLAGQQQQQHSAGMAPPTAHGRHHHQLGPGALTAAPAAVPKGMDGNSMRSVGNATARSAVGGTPGAVAAGSATPGPRAVQQQPVVHHGDELRDSMVAASIDLAHIDSLSRTIEISSEELASANGLLRGSAAYAAAAIAAQRAAAQQQEKPVLYSLAARGPAAGCPTSAGPTDELGRRATGDGGRKRSTADGGSRRATEDENAAAAGQVTASSGGQEAARHTGQQPGPAGAGDAEREVAAPATSPYRGHRSSNASTVSVSGSPAAARHGLDGDSVLYGSPNQARSAGGDAGASSGPVGSAAGSPYIPPSPPAGADPHPYMVSPPPSQAGSRLKRNSRNTIDDLGLGARPDLEGPEAAEAGADRGAMVPQAGASSDATLRPWSAASSKRQLATSGASSGPNSSVNFDLSLTQAAAAVASAGGRPPSAVSSPTPSARHLRTPAACGPVQVPLPSQHAANPQPPPYDAGQPAYSTFTLAALSPTSAQAQVASHDLSVDEAGQPFSPAVSPGASAAAGPSPRSGPADTAAKAAKPSAGSQQLQPQQAAPPLAAFSRAAALAAAADVGLPGPPSGAEGRQRHAGASSGGRIAEGPGLGAGAAGASSEFDAAPTQSRASPAASSHQRMPSAGSRGGAAVVSQGISDSYADYLDSQSPGPGSVAASAAKLSQLKARRQHHWQSQQSLQGDGAVPQGSTAAQEPQGLHQHDHHQQPQTSTPPPHRQKRDSGEHGGDGAGAAHGAGAQDRSASTPAGWQAAGSLRSPGPSDAVASPGVLPGASSPLLPEAVVQAIAQAASVGQDAAARGELNLGHGIAGLSVAIEAGAVKWAWQTDNQKDKRADPQPDPYARAAESPDGETSRDSTLRASSPTGGRGALGDSWALEHLPPPNWQRFGQLPPTRAEAKAREHSVGGDGRVVGQQHPYLEQQRQQPHPPHEDQYAAVRWHSEYSIPEPYREAKAPAGAGQHHYAHSAGGSASQAVQQQQQFRAASASDAGAQGSKAMALLRLKQQSIMRHNLGATEQRESEAYPAPSRLGYAQQPQSQQPQQEQAAAAGYLGQPAGGRPQRRGSAPRLPQSIAEEPSQYGSSGWPRETDVTDPGGQQGQPKAYLKRRSAKIQSRKVDWSYVKPRTNSRNPDYYTNPNSPPQVILKTRVSPLTSPKGGVAKPALGLGAGSYAMKKPSAKAALFSPFEEDRSALPNAAAKRRGGSNIPAAPAPAPAANLGQERPGHGRGAAGNGPNRAGGLSPLDDLLAHVNTLLRDFDKVVS